MSTRTVSHTFADDEGMVHAASLTLQNTADVFTYEVDGELVWRMGAGELRNMHALIEDVAENYI